MTLAAVFIFAAAVLATIALVAWAWVWFAVRHEASAMFSLGDFDGMHFDSAIPVHSRSKRAPLLKQEH